MHTIEPSELIINERGAIYHLNLRPEELAKTVITVGDPDRVAMVSKHFDRIDHKFQHREFISHTGSIGSKNITVLSTGIGPDNIDIALNELDALVNIDFNSRKIKNELQQLTIIRLGTSGSLQQDIPVDELVVATHGLGLDNLLGFYKYLPNEEEMQLLQQFIAQSQFHGEPYLVSASGFLLKHFVEGFHHGITVTCPGFYGPQGRVLRLGLAYPELNNNLMNFSFGNYRITNFEMETSAIYGLGKLLSHQCLSLNTIIDNRASKTFSSNAHKAVERLIEKALQIIANIKD